MQVGLQHERTRVRDERGTTVMHSQRSALVCTRQSTLSSQDSLEGTTHMALPCTLLVHGKHTVYIISRSADMHRDATDRRELARSVL